MTAVDAAADSLDDAMLLEVNNFARATPWLHDVLYACATYGTLVFAALLLAGWWIAHRGANPVKLAAAAWTTVGTVTVLAVSQPLVTAVHEARPYTALAGLLVLADRTDDYSFPSDHATLAGAIAAGLFLVHRRLGLLAAGAAAVMGFARVYTAAQYPRDVAAGLLIGAAFVLMGWLPLRRMFITLALQLRDTHPRAE